jgi:2-amino-4-hydroxy-6-hydroxymethyldihydropteridine diphosphokinase
VIAAPCSAPPASAPAPAPTPASGALVVVALGSNLGDSRSLLESAIERLRQSSGSPRANFRVSSFRTTAPIDCPPGSPPFLNAVVGFEAGPTDSPEALLTHLQELEREAGRRPKAVLNEPRPLDLDLIGFGHLTRATPELILPHPRAHLRRFVLEPLAEIAPDLRLPGWPGTAAELLARL